jgi:hypothetical protein
MNIQNPDQKLTEHTTSDVKAVELLSEARKKIETEIEKVIVGQKKVIEEILICLL